MKANQAKESPLSVNRSPASGSQQKVKWAKCRTIAIAVTDNSSNAKRAREVTVVIVIIVLKTSEVCTKTGMELLPAATARAAGTWGIINSAVLTVISVERPHHPIRVHNLEYLITCIRVQLAED